jgi:hypothetical protein
MLGNRLRRTLLFLTPFASIAAALLAAGLVFSGCGSGDPAPLPEKQFVEQANAICRAAERERDAASKAGAEEGLKEADFVTEAVLPSIQSMTDELGGLGAPKGDEEQVEAIVTAFEEGIEKLEEEPSVQGASDAAFAKANRLAEGYGLSDCQI